MRNWLIKLLGGTVKWEEAIDPIHVHLDFDEEKAKRLIDYAISGIFIKMQPPRKLFRIANPENQTITLDPTNTAERQLVTISHELIHCLLMESNLKVHLEDAKLSQELFTWAMAPGMANIIKVFVKSNRK